LTKMRGHMDEDRQNVNEVVDEESFEELLEKSLPRRIMLKQGQKVKVQVLKITDENIFLDLGGKSEGYLDPKELADEEGNLTVREGDSVEAYLLSADGSDLRFTTRIGAGDAARAHLEDAWRNGIPVEGVVEKEIKGGFQIKIAGGARGFCPYSQIGLQRVEDAGSYIGQRLSFRISEYGEKGRNVILSHRAILEEQRREWKKALRESLAEGDTVRGTITSIRNFGAFVDIGGVEGLIPISEIAWGRVEDIHDAVSVGQEVDVVIMKLDWERDRFSFSLKGAMPDPWENVAEKYPAGSRHTGRVARLTNYGAFITLSGGVDGLIHISRLGAGKRINHPREVIAVGQNLEVKIESVDKENKRISLALAGLDQQEDDKDVEDYRRHVERAPGSMGTLGDVLKARLSEKRKK